MRHSRENVRCKLLLIPPPLKIHLLCFSSWQSGEHRASVHQGEARRRDSIYLADANPDAQKGGHQYSHPGSSAGSHGSRSLGQ